MTQVFHPSRGRGHMQNDWLTARHSFSFGSFLDQERMNFGALRVLNDDIIAGGGGFPMHPHKNMEIVTIPLKGSLAHEDSEGHTSTISSGEIQIMSAGSGIMHSEFNPSPAEETRLLQIWILPEEKNTEPSYRQRSFDLSRVNTLIPLISPDSPQTLNLNQQTWFSRIRLQGDHSVEYKTHRSDSLIYFFLIEGTVHINDQKLTRRDAAGFSAPLSLLKCAPESSADLLIIEVPPVLE